MRTAIIFIVVSFGMLASGAALSPHNKYTNRHRSAGPPVATAPTNYSYRGHGAHHSSGTTHRRRINGGPLASLMVQFNKDMGRIVEQCKNGYMIGSEMTKKLEPILHKLLDLKQDITKLVTDKGEKLKDPGKTQFDDYSKRILSDVKAKKHN